MDRLLIVCSRVGSETQASIRGGARGRIDVAWLPPIVYVRLKDDVAPLGTIVRGGNVAYETAQQIQAELAAVAWLVAPQRVTGCSPADFVVTGWTDGVLVRFAAHGGRLDTWQVEHRATPPPRTATPGPVWEEFAAVNAELAARLAAGGRA